MGADHHLKIPKLLFSVDEAYIADAKNMYYYITNSCNSFKLIFKN